jgi:hypothetical protein
MNKDSPMSARPSFPGFSAFFLQRPAQMFVDGRRNRSGWILTIECYSFFHRIKISGTIRALSKVMLYFDASWRIDFRIKIIANETKRFSTFLHVTSSYTDRVGSSEKFVPGADGI